MEEGRVEAVQVRKRGGRNSEWEKGQGRLMCVIRRRQDPSLRDGIHFGYEEFEIHVRALERGVQETGGRLICLLTYVHVCLVTYKATLGSSPGEGHEHTLGH